MKGILQGGRRRAVEDIRNYGVRAKGDKPTSKAIKTQRRAA
ncbi:hypothetical protein N185_29135 [Sinorhizobium sp. GW3]|nr:hypothetical protein N185_29135 [Sinorhizobium sp. GW3]